MERVVERAEIVDMVVRTVLLDALSVARAKGSLMIPGRGFVSPLPLSRTVIFTAQL